MHIYTQPVAHIKIHEHLFEIQDCVTNYQNVWILSVEFLNCDREPQNCEDLNVVATMINHASNRMHLCLLVIAYMSFGGAFVKISLNQAFVEFKTIYKNKSVKTQPKSGIHGI